MARNVNSQYILFKQAVQRRFAERYRYNEAERYTDQDREHQKLVSVPNLPGPIVHRPTVRRVNRVTKRQNPKTDMSSFEKEYEQYIEMLKKNKAAKQEPVVETPEEPADTQATEPTAE